VSGAVPLAVTERVAVWPALIVTLAGPLVIETGTTTVTVAVLLLAEPARIAVSPWRLTTAASTAMCEANCNATASASPCVV
jgi:hypothetical protein